jgi:aryl-alcohol dehydrogenase-like predicted oxidoreductase
MIYRPFGRRLGWNISAIGMGTWNIGNQWGEIDDATSWATVRAAFEAGMNLFDTAEAYGTVHGLSEERLGVALAGLRHRVYVVSKIGHYGKRSGQAVPKTTVDMIRLCAHAILHRLRTDWVDVMLCHEADIVDPGIYLAAFEGLKKQGKIRAHGISTDSLEVLERYNADNLADVVEVDYSLLNRAAEQAVLPYCLEHGLGVLIRGPLAKGLLSGRYSAQSVFTDSIREKWHRDEAAKAKFLANVAKVDKLKKVLSPGTDMVAAALRFVISHPAAPVAIPGAKDSQQARMNAAAGDRTLTSEEIAELLAAVK